MDTITDMFNRIRNAQAVQKATVAVPWSKFKYQIAKILEREGFIESAERRGRTTKKEIKITLKYVPGIGEKRSAPAIRNIKRISKPGQRIYVSVRNLRGFQRGGTIVISTSKGLMTDKEAKKQRLGGEVICEVW